MVCDVQSLVFIFSQWNMQLEKVFDLEDLSRNTGSSDRCVKHPIVSLTIVVLGRFLFWHCMVDC